MYQSIGKPSQAAGIAANGCATNEMPIHILVQETNGYTQMMPEPDQNRRAILAKGLAFAATGLSIPACSSRGRTNTAILPGPVWPHERSVASAEVAPTIPSPTIKRAESNMLSVIPRTNWTRKQPIIAQTNPMVRIERITVHHDGMSPVVIRSKADAADRLEMIRSSHVDHRGWADIGYHLIVDPQGRVWQGRPMQLQGAHVKDHNPRNLGVLVMGNFEIQHPTREAITTLDRVLTHQARTHRVPLREIYTHREWASTACPGQNLQVHMDSARSPTGPLHAQLTRA